jgi:signal transduction histidine kinase
MHAEVPDQLGRLVEDLELAVYVMQPETGRCIFRSSALDGLVAQPDDPAGADADPVLSACHIDDRPDLEDALGQLASTGKPFARTVRLGSEDASWRQATGRWAAVSLDAGLLTVGVITAEPRRSALDRERVEKLSHDLRTPLNAVLGYAQLLGLNDLPADQRGSVDQIIAGGRRLLGVIETLEQT